MKLPSIEYLQPMDLLIIVAVVLTVGLSAWALLAWLVHRHFDKPMATYIEPRNADEVFDETCRRR